MMQDMSEHTYSPGDRVIVTEYHNEPGVIVAPYTRGWANEMVVRLDKDDSTMACRPRDMRPEA